ncbi:hypothetical protein [uncultured Gimesia sp.]|uniref:hypothetical protein n=1 Tax=uncultured Gimesia sp. TaxID=1678688 RepID=UPI00261469BF|nr:hypothetical protein [uncultured Gimesia sp.]
MTKVTPEMVRLKLSQLGLVLSPEINYRLETMFPRLDGIFLDRKIRKKFQQVKEIEPLLKAMLLKNEQVLFVTKGKIEYHESIVVLTNLRMLCMPVNSKEVPHQPFWFIYYTQVVDLKKIDSFIPRIRLKDGGKVSFQRFQDIDRKTISSVSLNAVKLLEEKGIDPSVSQSRGNMCSHCFEVVAKHEFECDACGATFWEPFEVGIRSLIFPSWGDFAMKDYVIAYSKLSFTVFIWVGIAFALANGEFFYAVLVFVTTNCGDAVFTYNSAMNARYLKQLPDND